MLLPTRRLPFIVKLISSFVIFTMLSSSLALNQTPEPAAEPQGVLNALAGAFSAPEAAAAPDAPPALPAATGVLRFSPAVDADDDPSSNPLAATAIPVARLGAAGDEGGDTAVRYAMVALAAVLVTENRASNPAGVMVKFRVWNEQGGDEMVQYARADAWGAASTQLFFDDQHLAGRFFYEASAPGFGQTAPRAFTFDANRFSSDVQLGASRVTTHFAGDGRLVVDVESDLPIDDALGAVQLTAVRLFAPVGGEGSPEKELLPPLVAERVDEHHARAEVYLDGGDYILSATAVSGLAEAHSEPIYVAVAPADLPEIASLEQIGDLTADGTAALVQYRSPDGYAVLAERSLEAIAAAPEPAQAPPPFFQETTRLGPFTYRTQTYATTLETIFDDHKKVVSVDGFDYDPLARTYTIKIESLMDEPVEDKLTATVYGPNGVIIYEETVPIWLDPDQPFEHKVVVPSDLGEPYGLRIVVHDPGVFEWAIEKIGDTLSTVISYIDGLVTTERGGFSLAAGFKFSLKVVEIDLATASILCNAGSCQVMPSKGLFFQPGDWAKTVTDGVRDFLRNQYRDLIGIEDMDAIIKKLGEGIGLGSLSLTATAEGRYTRTLFDPAGCPNQAALDAAKNYVKNLGSNLSSLGKLITFRGKTLSETLQSKGRLRFLVPGAWFLGIEIAPVLAFKVEGDKFGDYAVYGALTVEIGGKGSIKLKASSIIDVIDSLLAAKEYVVGIYRAVELIKLADQIIGLVNAAGKQSAAGGCGGGSAGGGGNGKKGNPPAPNGSPDDRRDAFQGENIELPQGVTGNILYFQQQLTLAQGAGLDRAATYFTLRLREAELAKFETDTTRAISHTLEMDELFNSAELQITGLISGTILPPPGQTLTESARIAYAGYLDGVANTTYDQDRRAYLDAVEFAEMQYAALRGQELQLQQELRQMLAATGMGIVDSGLVNEAIDSIGSLGVQPATIQIVRGDNTSSGLAASRYVPPYLAPPVVVVPSGGLYRFGGSAEARAWLDAYVSLGGTLIVLAQYDSPDWEMLPGGEVRGLGYLQDILCKDASVRIINASPYIVGFSTPRPNIQVDGSFTEWPANTTVVLMRTTGNQMPAMIEYPYGLGKVVATSAYPDFYMNGLQSRDDMLFARGLFGAAYLEATGQSLVAAPQPGQPVTLNVNVTNTTGAAVDRITFYRDYYNDRIGQSWRWAAHQPPDLSAADLIDVDPPLASGETREVEVNFTAPTDAGIFRTAYFAGVNTSTIRYWGRSGAISGPFYQVISPVADFDLLRFSLTADQPGYDFGAPAVVTATLFNDRNTSRTFTLQAVSGLTAAPVQVTVGAHSTEVRTYNTFVQGTRQVRLAAVENGETVSELVTTLHLNLPIFGLETEPEQMVAGIAADGLFTASVINPPPGTTTIDWQVRQGADVLLDTETNLVDEGDYFSATLPFTLPAAPEGAVYSVEAALPNSNRVLTAAIPVVAPATIFDVDFLAAPVIGAANEDVLFVALDDAGLPGTATVQAFLKQDTTELTAGPVENVDIGDGYQLVSAGLPLPDTLDLYTPYTVEVVVTSQITGSPDTHTDTFNLPLPLETPELALAHSSLVEGNDLSLLITPAPGRVELPSAGPYTVAIYGSGFTYDFSTNIETATPANGGGLELTLPLPDLPQGGTYEVHVTSPRLTSWEAVNTFDVQEYKLSYSAAPSAAAGTPLEWSVSNTGGVDVVLTGTLALRLPDGTNVSQTPLNGLALAVGATETLNLNIPSQLPGGAYFVRWSGVDALGRPLSNTRPLALTGLTVTLDSHTDQAAYLVGETITANNLINTTGQLEGAQLRLQVLKTGGAPVGWDGWGDEDAGSGYTSFVSQTAVPPLTPDWIYQADNSQEPVTVGSLVFTFNYNDPNYELTALDAADGTPVWSVPLVGQPYDLAANQSRLFLRTTVFDPETQDTLTAYDAASGTELWTQPMPYLDDILASETAVLVKTYDYNISELTYHLLDPVDGLERGVLASDEYNVRAMLTDSAAYVQNAGVLNAYDAITAAPLWSAPLESQEESLSANANYVLTAHDEYDNDLNEYQVILQVLDPADGAVVQNVTLAGVPQDGGTYVFPARVLTDDTLFYMMTPTGGGSTFAGVRDRDLLSVAADGDPTTIRAVDLATGTQTPVYTQPDAIYAIIGTGDYLQFSYANYDPDLGFTIATVKTIDATGAVIDTVEFNPNEFCWPYEMLAGERGLLLSADSKICALDAAIPLPGAGADGTSILREDWLAVDGNGTLNRDQIFDNPALSDNPEARGLLYLRADLYGSEPAGLPNPVDRVLLATSVYPFTIDAAPVSVVLQTDRPTYRANVAGYAPDDALATVLVSGEIRNTSVTTADVNLQIMRSDGTPMFDQTFTALGPDEMRTFSFSDAEPPAGNVVYTATTSLGDVVTAGIVVDAPSVTATSSVMPSQIFQGEPATLQASIKNNGPEPSFVTADLGSGPQVVMILAGETILLTQGVTPSTDGALEYPVIYTGDINRTDTLSLTVLNPTLSAAIELEGTLRANTPGGVPAGPSFAASSGLLLVQGDDAGLALVLTNPHDYPLEVVADYSLAGPEARVGSLPATLNPADDTTLVIPLGKLALGSYTAGLSVTIAGVPGVVATASLPFEVVAPIYNLSLTAEASPIDADGLSQVEFTAESALTSEQSWTGRLIVLHGKLVAIDEAVTLAPGANQTFLLTLDLDGLVGPQTLEAMLIAPDGQVAASSTLALDAEPRLAPELTLTGLTAGPTTPGAEVTLTANLTNTGPTGEAPLTFVAFDQTYEVLATVAGGSQEVTQTVLVPDDLLDGDYPATVRMGEVEYQVDVHVTGKQLAVQFSLDADSYAPFGTATWTVQVQGVSGGPDDYDVSLRYGLQENVTTVNLGAGDSASIPWSFNVGPAGDRATVLVQTHPDTPEQTRHSLVIDSQWVPVIEDSCAWLESDKNSYDAGETIHLTMHLLTPSVAAMVMLPEGLPSAEGPLLWSSLSITDTYSAENLYVQGDFPFDYALPATVATGRYLFSYFFDGEERTLPIDVHGVTLLTEDYTVAGPDAGPLSPDDALTINANLRLNAPLANAQIQAYTLTPSGELRSLGAGAALTLSLPAGVTPITLNGVLDTTEPGAHQIVLNVFGPDSMLLGGDSAYVDVGSAAISSLTTDRGVYTPGQPGTGTVVVYGAGDATVEVHTSGGESLFNQVVSLDGFQSFDFAIPTATEMDEVLLATVTDSGGLVSTLQVAYKVASAFDTTAPEVEITSPENAEIIELASGGDHTVVVTGTVSDDIGIETLLVNGEPVVPAGGVGPLAGLGSGAGIAAGTSTWQATVILEPGDNFIEAVAVDNAGNYSLPDTILVSGEPGYGITFAVSPVIAGLGDTVTYTAVVTATESITATVLFPFSVTAVEPTSGAATTGTLTLDKPVAWEGQLDPGQPVTIQWQGTATEPISRTILATVAGDQLLAQISNEVETEVKVLYRYNFPLMLNQIPPLAPGAEPPKDVIRDDRKDTP